MCQDVLLENPFLAKDAGLSKEVWEFRADVFKYDIRTFYPFFSSDLKIILRMDLIHASPPQIRFEPAHKKKSHKTLPMDCDSSAYFSQQCEPKPFSPPHNSI